ncbi:MAG: hypothetical protein ABI843_11260 [Dokdonella sp.]
MDQSLYLHWVVPLCMLLMAGCLLSIGLRGLLARRPFVVSGRWAVLCVCAWATTQFWWIVAALFGGHMSQQWSYVFIGALASASLIGMGVYFGARGYWAYGVTTTSLHEGLRASLKALGLRSEVGFGGVYPTPSGAHISVSIHHSRGVGRITADHPARRLLRDVVAGMNRYYAASNVTTVWTACYLYTAVGLLLLGWVLFSVLFLRR